MAFSPTQAAPRVRVGVSKNGKYTQHRVSWRVGGFLHRRTFPTAEEATIEAARISEALEKSEGESTRFRLSKVAYYAECERMLGATPLHVAIEYFKKMNPDDAQTIAFIAAERIKDLIAKKVSRRSLNTHRAEIGIWIKAYGTRLITEVSAKDIQLVLETGDRSPTTQRNLLRAYRSLELFAQRRRYLSRDHDSVIPAVSSPKIRLATPEIYTPEEMARYFIAAAPEDLVYLAVMAFGGGRRAEVERMTATNFALDEKMIVVDAEIAKKGMRRTLDVPPVLREWIDVAESLASVPKEGSIAASQSDFHAVNRLAARRASLDVPMRKNGLRHSFCSYHYALHRNVALTASLAGNSAGVIEKHYKALVGKVDAERWFNLTPQNVRDYASDHGLTEHILW